MALKQDYILSGVLLKDTYVKISNVTFRDYKTPDGKRYRVDICIERHGNSDKKGIIESRHFQFDKLLENEVRLPILYGKIKDKLTGSKDLL